MSAAATPHTSWSKLVLEAVASLHEKGRYVSKSLSIAMRIYIWLKHIELFLDIKPKLFNFFVCFSVLLIKLRRTGTVGGSSLVAIKKYLAGKEDVTIGTGHYLR